MTETCHHARTPNPELAQGLAAPIVVGSRGEVGAGRIIEAPRPVLYVVRSSDRPVAEVGIG